ncbi:MAG: hypothetical protein WAT46_16010 [Saprospiraceae bacterium]|jgi:hypothetical protein|nr:hypothetical protein [Saprospiraceae bacterium]
MTTYKEYRYGGGNSPFGFLGPLLILAVFFTILFFMAKGLFWLLSWATPVLLILTLIIDYKVIKDFFSFIWKLLKENPWAGVLAVVMIVFAYPFVAGYLFIKALGKRSIKKAMEKVTQEKNTYTDYEEVVEEDDSFLELPPLKRKPEPIRHEKGNVNENVKNDKANEYDDMFK